MGDTETTSRPPEGDWLGTPFLRFERRGPLAVMTLDRPEARNAMSPAMYFGIRYAVEHVNREDDLAGLLITGSGDVFAPGGDMGGGGGEDWSDVLQHLGMDITPFDTIRRSAKPVVCAVNGLAQGGGMMIAMLSDISVAATSATFRAPELLRGIADTNYAQILPRQVGPARARDLLLTGRTLTAEEALDWGLVARIAPDEQLMDAALEALEACCRTAPGARSDCKRVMDRFYGHYDRAAMEASVAGPEMVEGYQAFKERRSPAWVPEALRRDGRL